jgi:hypothetical protein
VRKATGPIRPLMWGNGCRKGVYIAPAPELGEGGLYTLRVCADGTEASWSVGRNAHDAWGGNIGTFREGGRRVCAEAAMAAIDAHFTDAIEAAIARMRGLA